MAWLTIPALARPAGRAAGRRLHHHLLHLALDLPDQRADRPWPASGSPGASCPTSEPAQARPLDKTGFVLSALAASGVVFGFPSSACRRCRLVGLVAPVRACLAALLYLRHARRTTHPILNLSLFRNKVFRAAIIGGSTYRIGSRRDAVSSAAAVPARLRHDAVPIRHVDLRLRFRRDRR